MPFGNAADHLLNCSLDRWKNAADTHFRFLTVRYQSLCFCPWFVTPGHAPVHDSFPDAIKWQIVYETPTTTTQYNIKCLQKDPPTNSILFVGTIEGGRRNVARFAFFPAELGYLVFVFFHSRVILPLRNWIIKSVS